jgi:mannose-6-phosphate isomerase-like protein (cupin superfamily)
MPRLSLRIIPAAILLMSFFFFSKGALSQSMTSDHWSPANLLERAKNLHQLAEGKGSASETLEKYPHHYTMLAFRNRSGGGELHQNFADVFYILDGHATLATGGEVVDPKTTAPGETLGASVKGGKSQELKAGDVVHIPAGMPHQMELAEGETVTYFVVKIEETR